MSVQHEYQRRDIAMTRAIQTLTGLLRCVLYLVCNGIFVIGFKGSSTDNHDQVVVNVAHSPRLHDLFGENCFNHRQAPNGELMVHTWSAELFGVRIEWEEVSP